MENDSGAAPRSDEQKHGQHAQKSSLELGRNREKEQPPKKQLLEVLRPRNETAEKMREQVYGVVQEAVDHEPNEEQAERLKLGAGVVLWELLANDTGKSLPKGLIYSLDTPFKNAPSPYWSAVSEFICFESDVLQQKDYEKVITILRDKGVLDKLVTAKREDREQRREEISDAMEKLITHSALMDYFDSFTVTEQGKTEKPIRPFEEATLRATLQSKFKEKWGVLPTDITTSRRDIEYFNTVSQPLEETLAPQEESIKEDLEAQFTAQGAELPDIQLTKKEIAYMKEVALPLKKLHQPETIAVWKERFEKSFQEKWHTLPAERTFDEGEIAYIKNVLIPLQDAIGPQEKEMRAKLEASFKEVWGTTPAEHQTLIKEAYKREVERPIAMATEERLDSQSEPNRRQEDLPKKRFQTFLRTTWLKDDASKVFVKDGKFFRRSTKLDEDQQIVETSEEDHTWWEFASRETFSLTADFQWAQGNYPTHAFDMIGPRLYDPNDKRDFKTIIETGIKDAAKKFADELITEGLLLDANNHKSEMVAWLTSAIGPIATAEQIRGARQTVQTDYHEPEYKAPKQEFLNKVKEKEEEKKISHLTISTAKEIEKDANIHLAQIQFVDHEEVFGRINQRLIKSVPKNPNLPTPDELSFFDINLLITFTDHAKNLYQGISSNLIDDENEPFIYGMKLIGRNEETGEYAYQLDPDQDVYAAVEKEIPEDKRDKMIEICQEIGMSTLASKIEQSPQFTIEEFRLLARPYMTPWIPDRKNSISFNVKTLQDLIGTRLIDDEGNFHAQCNGFEFFFSEFMKLVYEDRETSPVYKEGGYSLNASDAVDIQKHVQTRLIVPEEGINALIDMEPAGRFKTGEEWEGAPAIEEEVKDTETEKTNLRDLLEELKAKPYKIDQTDWFTELDPEIEQNVDMIQKRIAIETAGKIFALDLTMYLDLKNRPVHYEGWKDEVLKNLQPTIKKGPDVWRTIPHIGVFNLLRKYRQQPEEAPASQTELGELQKTLTQYKTKPRPERLTQLINKNILPDYDEVFIKAMDRLVTSFLKWNI